MMQTLMTHHYTYQTHPVQAQTITGITSGTDGQRLTLVNAEASSRRNSIQPTAGQLSTAANRITTGTGADITLAPGASIDT